MRRAAFMMGLFLLSALLVSHLAPEQIAVAQKVKDKKKKKETTPPTGAEKEDDGRRVTLAFDSGAHVRAISSMGFTKDGAKLITVGQDFTVQIWSTTTGERLDILRLPGYSREQASDLAYWDVSAVAPDGSMVAIGGQSKPLFDHESRAKNPTRLMLVDLTKRKVTRVELTGSSPVSALAFSPDGNTLAVGLEGASPNKPQFGVIGNVKERSAKDAAVFKTDDCTFSPLVKENPRCLEFSPDGKRLLVAAIHTDVQLWDVPEGAAPKPKWVKTFDTKDITTSLSWAPDAKQIARACTGVRNGNKHRRLELWDMEGKLTKSWTPFDLPDVTEKNAQFHYVRFLNEKDLFFTAQGFVAQGTGTGSLSGVLDISTGKNRRVYAQPEGMVTESLGGASADGKFVAQAVSGRTEVIISKLNTDAKPVRCGNRSPIPFHVGWSKDEKQPGFAWSDVFSNKERKAELLHGFDLVKVQPMKSVKDQTYQRFLEKHNGWEFVDGMKNKDDDVVGGTALQKDGKNAALFYFHFGIGHTLVPNGEDPPLVAHAQHFRQGNERLGLFKHDGTLVARLAPDPTSMNDIAPSPDGEYLISTTGTPRINIYRMGGSSFPMFSFAQTNGEWVLWTQEGYYAASPGGEKLLGWAVNNGPNTLVGFEPATKYAKDYHRPDILKLAMELGSVKEAIEKLKVKTVEVSEVLPPKATLKLLEQNGTKVKVQATATSSNKAKSVIAMRVLLNGRPFPGGLGVWDPEKAKEPQGEFELEIPAGLSELKVLARTEDGAGVSEVVLVRAPKNPENQPTIHCICIGINDYDDPGLKLGSAAKDAEQIFAALQKHCVGPYNRFAAARGELILNKDATRERVRKAIQTTRDKLKLGDLIVVFFAGHGIKQEKEFYLATREADLSQTSMEGKSVSGKDLNEWFKDIDSPVLLILDACHSAKIRPATDELTRQLTDPSVGITVLCASMAHETAGATSENGYFTAGILKALQAEAGTPYDPYEKQMYVHHIYSVTFSEVRRATNGKQNPFLNMPWTSAPIPVREVSLK
jgi:hypothetical protein